MNQQQYKTAWQIACWSTLAIVVFSVLALISGVFSILSTLSIGAIGAGFLMAANELVKAGNPAANDLKAAAMTLFIICGLGLLGAILAASIDPLSNGKTILIFSGLLTIASGVFAIILRNKIAVAFNGLSLNAGLMPAGILVYAIGQMVAGFGVFIFGIAPGAGTLGIMGVLALLGGLAALVGAILWIIGMFQATAQATK